MVFVQPPQKKNSEWSQTSPTVFANSTELWEAFGPLRNPKMRSQELPEQTNPPKFLIFLAFLEKNVLLHISVSFWVSEVIHTLF